MPLFRRADSGGRIRATSSACRIRPLSTDPRRVARRRRHDAVPRDDLPPDRRRETAPHHLDERQGEGGKRGLARPETVSSPLCTRSRRLVAKEVLDTTSTPAARYARCWASATYGLRPPADAEDAVRRVGLEAELGEPDADAAAEGVRVSWTRRSSVASEIVVQREQPPDVGAPPARGCRMVRVGIEPAPARPMPRMKSTGDVPPGPPRGAVAPPAIDARGMTALIAVAAGSGAA